MGPAGHGVELRLRLHQVDHSCAYVIWHRWSTRGQQLDSVIYFALPAWAIPTDTQTLMVV